MGTRKWLTLLGIAATVGGLYLLYSVLKRYDFHQVAQALRSVPWWRIAVAFACTGASYLCLVVLEYLAVTYTGTRLAPRRIVRTTIAALSIGHTLGLAALSSGAIRYRMYRRSNMKASSVGEVVVFSGVSVAVGLAALGGIALLLYGNLLGPVLHLAGAVVDTIAIALLASVAGYVILCALVRRSLNIRKYRFRLPSWGTACWQVIASSANYLCVAAVLFIVVSGFTEVDYPRIAALYVGADFSAVAGHVPGGWGLIEYIVTRALPGPGIFSGVLAFRAIYYFVPLAVGGMLFLLDEWQGRGRLETEQAGASEAK